MDTEGEVHKMNSFATRIFAQWRHRNARGGRAIAEDHAVHPRLVGESRVGEGLAWYASGAAVPRVQFFFC